MFWLYRFVLSLRYRLTIKAPAQLSKQRSGGFLFLPNHVAHCDPPILAAWLWPKFHMRPVVVEFVHRTPVVGWFTRMLKAFPIPDVETSVNQFKTRKAERVFAQVAAALKRGENVLLYSSGKLKKSGIESLQGNAGLHRLVEQCPEANVVLVRTRGLWGSSFSKALQGSSPNLVTALRNGVKILLKNLLFFTPRRPVEIELQSEPSDFPRSATRAELNQYLENWYNRDGPEPLQLIPYYFWDRTLPTVQTSQGNHEVAKQISSATQSKIYAAIREILKSPNLKISPEMRLGVDLGMDSLNLAELVAYLGQTYHLRELHPDQVETVQDALGLAEGSKQTEARQIALLPGWPEEKGRPPGRFYPGKTLPEVFLNASKALAPFAACADDAAGIVTYGKARQAALVLAQAFRLFPEEKVAILLPASAGAYITYFGLLLAGKIPVMLNWTLGPRYLEQMMQISGATRALSSWRFLERLSDVDFGTVADQIELLEDIRAHLTLSQKIGGALLAHCSTKWICRALSPDENRPALILFTSGTEAAPKGVPLSHRNLLVNLDGMVRPLFILPDNVFYGFLPPFHSFGFTSNGILSWVYGWKTVYSPDPTDSYQLAAGIQRWQVDTLIVPPTFLKRILQVATRDQLHSLHLVIVGAEKVSKDVLNLWKQLELQAEIVEGYGATECSPVISVVPSGTAARLGHIPEGAGQVLPGLSVCTIHPETQALLPDGSEGELCVRGPSVFRGYLGDVASPFIEINGEQWYRTGDIGRVDSEQYIHLTDRLKRFAKIGGEMISLGGVEKTLFEALLKKGQVSADQASLAVCADEVRQQLLLFTTVELDKDEINRLLLAAGFSRLVKIGEIVRVPEIPLMANGKINYRSFQGERGKK